PFYRTHFPNFPNSSFGSGSNLSGFPEDIPTEFKNPTNHNIYNYPFVPDQNVVTSKNTTQAQVFLAKSFLLIQKGSKSYPSVQPSNQNGSNSSDLSNIGSGSYNKGQVRS